MISCRLHRKLTKTICSRRSRFSKRLTSSIGVGISPFVRFAFKHVLLRDAIYDSLLKSKRQQIHADIAAILKRRIPGAGRKSARSPRLSTTKKPAITNWLFVAGSSRTTRAGAIRQRRSDCKFSKGSSASERFAGNPERIKQEIDIQLALGIPLIAVQGYAAAETREAFSRARTLCLRLGNIPEYFQALFGCGGTPGWRKQSMTRSTWPMNFYRGHKRYLIPCCLMVAHRVMGSTLLTVGDFDPSAESFRGDNQAFGQEKRPLYNLYMVEPQAASLLLLSWDLWFLGYPDQSLSRVSEALALGQALGHPYTVAFAHYMTSVVHLLRGDAARVGGRLSRGGSAAHPGHR